jgi:hypothetical protein
LSVSISLGNGTKHCGGWEGRIHMETRQLQTGSEMKLMWHRAYRFYKRSADEVFKLVDWYSTAATDGALGMLGEHLVLAAFARQKFLLVAEEANAYSGKNLGPNET